MTGRGAGGLVYFGGYGLGTLSRSNTSLLSGTCPLEQVRQLVKRSGQEDVELTEFLVFLLQLHNIVFSHFTGASARWWGTATHLSVLLRAAFVGLTLRRRRYDVCTEARQTKRWRLPVTLAWLRLFKAVRALPGWRTADNSALLPGFSVTASCLLFC